MAVAYEKIGDGNWSMPELKVLVQSKITQRTACATVELQDAYKLFGRPTNGITPSHFRKQLQKWGIKLSSSETLAFLKYLGVQNTNAITFSELVQRIMPNDYVGKIWNVVSDEATEKREKIGGFSALKELGKIPHKIEAAILAAQSTTRPVKALQVLILSELLSKTSNEKERLIALYNLFGRPKASYTESELYACLIKLKIFMTRQEFSTVFHQIPQKNAGQVTFEEMIEYFIPNTFSKESWISLRQLLPSFYQEEIRRSLKETHFPSSMKHFRWPIKEIEKKIQDKIGERAANATVEKQDAFKIFDCPSKGITKPLFKSKMEKLGLFLSNREITELYKRYDPDGDGTITFQEFMSAVMPQDYSKQSNSTISNTTTNNNTTLRPLTASSSTNVAASYGQVAQAVLNMTEPHALKYLGRKRWSIEFMQELLREKIRSRTSNSNVEIQDAYKLFGRPQKGITLEIFREKLWEFGMEITSEEAKELFDHYDLNGSRTITFGELIEGVIPRDYSRKTWNVARTEEIIQQQQEKLRQMREGESRRHGRRQRNKHQHKKKNFDDNNNNNNQLGAFQNLNFHFENANENDTTTGGTMSLQGLQIEGKKANSPFLNQMCPPKSPRAFLTPINSKT